MSNESTRAEGSARLAQMLVGFLIGSGGAGAAMALVGKEGFQLAGVILFVVCLLVAYLVYSREQRKEEGEGTRLVREEAQVQVDQAEEKIAELTRQAEQLRGRGEETELRHRADLTQLKRFYVSTLTTVGNILAIRLALHERDTEMNGARRQGLTADVLTMLADQTRQQAQVMSQAGANRELSEGVLEDVMEIIGEWERFAEEPVSLREGPPDEDTQPVQDQEQDQGADPG